MKQNRKLFTRIYGVLSILALAGAIMAIFQVPYGKLILIVSFFLSFFVLSIDNRQKSKRIRELEAQLKKRGD